MIELSKLDATWEHVLAEAHVDPASLVLLMRTDLSDSYENTEAALATTDCALLVIRDGRRMEYPFSELREPRLDERIGACALLAKRDGRLCELAVMTNRCKHDCRLFVKYLEQQLKKSESSGRCAESELELDEKDFLREDFCPKCHRRYPDPNRRVCPKCMDRAGLIGRFWTLAKRFRGQIALALLAMLVMSALSIAAPYISTSFFYDQVLDIRGTFYGQLLFVITLMVATQLLTIVLGMLCDIIMARVSAKLVYTLKRTIFDSIRRLSMRFFSGRQTGGLMTQINNDANAIYWFFVNGFSYFFTSILQVVAVFVLMLVIDVPLALAALIPLPLYLFMVVRVLREEKWLYARYWGRSRALNSVLSDALGGVRVVKAFAREREETERFGRYSRASAGVYRDLTVFNNTRYPILNAILYVSTLIVWGVGGWMTMRGDITYGTLMVFLSYVGILNAPMFNFIDMSHWLAECLNALQRLFEIMDAEPDVREAENPVRLPAVRGDVEFRGVDFSYEKGKRTLEGISFQVPAGRTLGIVGHSGAGKSTLANLLIRLYDADNGGIYIDGVNVRDMAFEDLRRSVSIVSQETYLFMGSILENIAYARPDASRAEIIAASKIAGAHEFIMKLPDAYETRIGFGYKDLSGGERQRLSIARAILKNPRILILDEATAAMDTATERHIQQALTALSRGRTTIMIAHRLSTLRDADSLIVIENGKMPEQGTHVELLRQKGIYYKLYQLQLSALKNIGVEE